MFSSIREKLDSFLGRGKYSASVPVMDGPLQPNRALEEAEVFLSAPGLDNLVAAGDALYVSSGTKLTKVDADGRQKEATEFESEITCLASDGSAALAVGLDGRGLVILGGRHDGRVITTVGNSPLICPTAVLFLNEDKLVVASGSANHSASQWKRDLMALGKSGSVWMLDLKSGDQQLVRAGLAYPYGLEDLNNGDLLVSEAWRHRLIQIGSQPASPMRIAIDDLPGYPSRLLPSGDGGHWLTVFAPRNQLTEFVLGERAYCNEMIKQVDPAYWVAPALSSGASFKEVLQYGAVKQMGISKSWAPTWSYGLVVLLGSDFQPVASWHSRADGTRHGVTSLARSRGRLLVGAKGAGQALILKEHDVSGEQA